MSVHKRIVAAAVPLFVALAAVGAAATSGRADTANPSATAQGPLRCEIQKSAASGGVSLVAVVHSDAAVSGSYTFHVTSGGNGGSSNISQGGPFAAAANGAVTLGTVMLGTGASYDAALTVTANGATVACADKAGGAI
jgi:hypothetical protein